MWTGNIQQDLAEYTLPNNVLCSPTDFNACPIHKWYKIYFSVCFHWNFMYEEKWTNEDLLQITGNAHVAYVQFATSVAMNTV